MLFIHIFCPCIYVFFIVLSSFGFISQSSIKPIFTISTQHFFFFVKFYKRIYIWDIIIFHIRWLSRNILYIHQQWHLIYLHFIFVYLYYQIFKHFPNKKTIFFLMNLANKAKMSFYVDFHITCSWFFFIYPKFYSQKSEWDWAAGIAYLSPLPTERLRYSHYNI